jgi:hypothetical protein
MSQASGASLRLAHDPFQPATPRLIEAVLDEAKLLGTMRIGIDGDLYAILWPERDADRSSRDGPAAHSTRRPRCVFAA